MWMAKLGLSDYNAELLQEVLQLMLASRADYNMFFRELSHLPSDISPLKRSFYAETSPQIDEQWQAWLQSWRALVIRDRTPDEIATAMKLVNPKHTWREWLIVPAYQRAEQGDYTLIRELQKVLSHPYDCLLYTSPSPRDATLSRMPSSA